MVSKALLGFIQGFAATKAAQRQSAAEHQDKLDQMVLQNYFDAQKLEQQYGYQKSLTEMNLQNDLQTAIIKSGGVVGGARDREDLYSLGSRLGISKESVDAIANTSKDTYQAAGRLIQQTPSGTLGEQTKQEATRATAMSFTPSEDFNKFLTGFTSRSAQIRPFSKIGNSPYMPSEYKFTGDNQHDKAIYNKLLPAMPQLQDISSSMFPAMWDLLKTNNPGDSAEKLNLKFNNLVKDLINNVVIAYGNVSPNETQIQQGVDQNIPYEQIKSNMKNEALARIQKYNDAIKGY